jgi:hypothetical protein
LVSAPGGADGGALAAGDAGTLAHRLVEVKADAGAVALAGAADDVVALHLVAAADAAVAEDAGGVIDRDHGGGVVESRGTKGEYRVLSTEY